LGYSRDEAKYPDEQEHDTEKNRGGFNHYLISCWSKDLRLSQQGGMLASPKREQITSNIV